MTLPSAGAVGPPGDIQGRVDIPALRSISPVHRLGRSFGIILAALLVLTVVPGYSPKPLQRTASAAENMAQLPLSLVPYAGQTNPADFPTTSDAFDTTFSGFPRPERVRFSTERSGAELIYNTFFDVIYGSGIAGVGSHQIVFTGRTGAILPTTPNAFDPTYSGGFNDAFVVKLNLNEPTAVELAGLAVGSAMQASQPALRLAIAAAALLLATAALLRRRHLKSAYTSATTPTW